MQKMKKMLNSTKYAKCILLFLPLVRSSSHEHAHKISNHKVNSYVRSDMIIHGILLWASMGFWMPLGILLIRISNREESRRWLKLLFYLHVISQMFSVLLATAGAILSIKSFENSFNNHHQRIGLALYIAIWVQAIIGFRRPLRGSKGRSSWYFMHWLLGTTICVVGILNIYTGLEAYHKRTSRSTSLWTILFTSQIFIMAFFYLFQDKWDYMQKQGVVLGNEQITTSDQPIVVDPQHDTSQNNEPVVAEPARKSNSLGNYFAKNNALKKLFQLS